MILFLRQIKNSWSAVPYLLSTKLTAFQAFSSLRETFVPDSARFHWLLTSAEQGSELIQCRWLSWFVFGPMLCRQSKIQAPAYPLLFNATLYLAKEKPEYEKKG